MKKIFSLFLFLSLSGSWHAQTDTITENADTEIESFNPVLIGFDDAYRGNSSLRAMFYNVENLFDIYDDTLKNDDTFTPDGNNHWNNFKYYEKQKNLGKTILAVGGWEAVEIIGLCEVENIKVLNDLTTKTILKNTKYSILHQESPDKRGIDVALLYRADKITVDTVQYIQVFLGKDQRPTRDILYATLLTLNQSKLHVFVNHWPSRYGGQMVSDPKRKMAARVVRGYVDSILLANPNANILLMGDFNDEPENESIHKVLRATSDTTFTDPTDLFNVLSGIKGTRGTHKYQGSWGVLDQFMVSKSLYKGLDHLQIKQGNHIFNAPFLLTEETKYPGLKPYRTYIGFKYSGGYSDHLPIYIDLQILK